MQVYKDYSKLELRLDDDTITLKLWRCSRVKRGDIISYCLNDEYSSSFTIEGDEKEDPDYTKFIKYLGIDTTDEYWWSRCGQTISEEPVSNCFGDEYSVYKFHYLVQTAEGDILNIIPFSPVDCELRE